MPHYHTHDYHEPHVYMVTVVTEGRQPLLGRLDDNDGAPAVTLSAVGQTVEHELQALSARLPQLRLLQHRIMPSFVHMLVAVVEPLPANMPLNALLEYWKQTCQNAHSQFSAENPLFAESFYDTVLTSRQQADLMADYIMRQPRRLLTRQQHASLFTLHHNIHLAGMPMDAMGNFDLLRHLLLAVHCRHDWTTDETADYTAQCLAAARQGAVLTGAFISPAEKAILKAATEAHIPTIRLLHYGFAPHFEPEGADFDDCAEGRLLFLSPFPYRDPALSLNRQHCMLLNDIAEAVAAANIWQEK